MFLPILLFMLAPPAGSGLLGNWITPDKSIIQIYDCSQAICARIAHVDEAIGHSTDGLNPDPAKRDRPLCGLMIGSGFQLKEPGHAEGGTLYDPHSGHTYSGTLSLVNQSTLKLHGYIGLSIFGRTEEWHRAQNAPVACKA